MLKRLNNTKAPDYFFLFLLDKGGGDDRGGSAQQNGDPAKTKDSEEGADDSRDNDVATGTAPDSPSKQLPDQISFFSGNPSVEIVHGIMHLYKTK